MNSKNEAKETAEPEGVRLNKYISESGECSRREADRMIQDGKVTINDRIAVLGERVSPGDVVKIGEKTLTGKPRDIVLAVNKPKGIVCTESAREKDSIIRFLNYPKRITYAGRLDKDSRGLLLMTNNGDLINAMMRARNQHEKEYRVSVNKPVTPEFTQAMANGVPILDTVTRPCEVKIVGKYTFRIVLTQGLNRQIRRMCEALGYRVTDLLRIRVMNVELGDLKEGESRELSDTEREELYQALRLSES